MCRFLDNDGHCAFHSDAEVKEYCVAGPCPDMQTYKELADALRKAGSDTQYYEAELYDDAADAIERLQKQNEELKARWAAATIEGFPVKDLMLFAMTCRKNRVAERDLQAFARNMEKALEIVRKEFDEALHRSMERTFQYGTELNDACRKQNGEENRNDSIRPN